MKHIEFKGLTARNFLSIGETPLKIDFKSGLNVITGINLDKEDSRNGVGKSSVPEIVHFAFFGTTIRDLSKEHIVNSYSKKNCKVVLDFSITDSSKTTNYTITRTLFPTKCFVEADGVDVTRSTLPKTNEFLRSLINSNSSVFQNSVIMTMNNTTPFMAQGKIEKRKFIENILQLEVFSKMLSLAKETYVTLKREYDIVWTKKEAVEKHFKTVKEQLDTFETNKKTKLEELEAKIKELEDKIKELEKSLVSEQPKLIKQLEDKIKELKTNYDNEGTVFETLLEEKAEAKHQVTHLKQILSDTQGILCPTCSRPFEKKEESIDKEKVTKQLQDAEAKLETKSAEVDKCQTKRQDILTNIEKLKAGKKSLEDKKANNNNIRIKIDFHKESITDTQKEITKVKGSGNEALAAEHDELLKQLTEHRNTISALDYELTLYDTIKFIVSEEGVKTFIVKKILKMLNARLEFYLQKLEGNCHCAFNEYFEECIIDEYGNAKSYFNFSGGERKRLDLACLFAFLDIRKMQGDSSFNITFYDELLDSALDNRGVELVLSILRDRFSTHNESCYIITHRGNVVIGKVDNTLMLEKRNGFTYVSM